MTSHKYTTLICFSLIWLCSYISACSKSPVTSNTSPVDTIGQNPPKDLSGVDIYIAGDTMIRGNSYACYWKNGILTQLPAGMYSYSSSIVVSGNDIYVNSAGTYFADSLSYWKNGTNVIVHDTLGYAHRVIAITASGNDVYVTGVEHEYPALNYGVVYWKNNSYGVHFVQLGVTNHDSWGEAITVDNGDVYIAGKLDNKAVMWKNGSIIHLSVDTLLNNYNSSVANSICVDKGNVFIAGVSIKTLRDINLIFKAVLLIGKIITKCDLPGIAVQLPIQLLYRAMMYILQGQFMATMNHQEQHIGKMAS